MAWILMAAYFVGIVVLLVLWRSGESYIDELEQWAREEEGEERDRRRK